MFEKGLGADAHEWVATVRMQSPDGWRLRVELRALNAAFDGCEPDGELVFHSAAAH